MLTDLNPAAYSPIVQAIVYDSALSCLIIDHEGRLAFVNPRLAADMQLDEDSPADAGWWLDVCPRPPGTSAVAAAQADGAAILAGDAAAGDEDDSLGLVLARVLGGQSWSGELLLRSRNGQLSHQQAMLTPIPDSMGRPASVLGIFKPLTVSDKARSQKGRMAQPAESQVLLDIGEGLRQTGNDLLRYEQRLLRFSAAFENAAEDLLGLLRHGDHVQIRCYLETLRVASAAIGSQQTTQLADELIQMVASPEGLVPTPILAIFESLMLSLQEAILDALEQRSRRNADACPPELDRRLGTAALDRMMQDLMAFLHSYDLNAIDTFSALMEGARGVPLYCGIELARPYLESFAFEKALRIVESVWRRTHPEAAAEGRNGSSLGSGRLPRRPPRKRSAMPASEAAMEGPETVDSSAGIMDDLFAMIGGET